MKNKKDKNYNRFKEKSENRFELKITFKTHNDKDIDINMTHLQGYITTSYDKLVEAFGEPMLNTSSKTDAEWEIEFSDGVVATIYCWKNYGTYSMDQIDRWNIGGHEDIVVERITEYLKNFKSIIRGKKLNRISTDLTDNFRNIHNPFGR